MTEFAQITVAGSTAAFGVDGGATTLTCSYKGNTTTLLVPGGLKPSGSTGGAAGGKVTYTTSNSINPNSWLLGSMPGEAGGNGTTNYTSGTRSQGGKVFSTKDPAFLDYFAEFPQGVFLAFGNFAGGAGMVGTTGGAGGAASYIAEGGGHTADNKDHLASKGSGGMGSTSADRSKGGAA